jgi:hypothetical protein
MVISKCLKKNSLLLRFGSVILYNPYQQLLRLIFAHFGANGFYLAILLLIL